MGKEGRSLFVLNRTQGLICNGLPISRHDKGSEYFLLASTGLSYVVYNGSTLRQVFAGKVFEGLISTLVGTDDSDRVYCTLSDSRTVMCYERYKLLFSVELEMVEEPMDLKVFRTILIVCGRSNIELRDAESGAALGMMNLAGGSSALSLGGIHGNAAIYHHPGCVNEYLAGGQSGRLCTFDISTKSVLVSFEGIRKALIERISKLNTHLNEPSLLDDWTIDCLAGSQQETRGVLVAVSSVRVSHRGLVSPVIFGLDEESDTVVATITLDRDQYRVSSMCFKDKAASPLPQNIRHHDGNPEVRSLLYAGCENGDIVVCSVDDQKIITVSSEAHEPKKLEGSEISKYGCGVTTLLSVSEGGSSGCIFLSSGCDNALKQWHIVDLLEPPKILRTRAGFSGHINNFLFYSDGTDCKEILVTARSDSKTYMDTAQYSSSQLGIASYIAPASDMLFPQRNAMKKMNGIWSNPRSVLTPITSICANADRHYDWPNILTCHEGLHQVMIWGAKEKCLFPGVLQKAPDPKAKALDQGSLTLAIADLGRMKKLKCTPPRRSTATCVAISKCGNFAVVGYADGQLHCYNVQSRRHMGMFEILPQDDSPGDKTSSALKDLAMDTLHETDPVQLTRKRKLLRTEIVKQHALSRKSPREFHDLPHRGPIKHVVIAFGMQVYTSCQDPRDLTLAVWDLMSRKEIRRLNIRNIIDQSVKDDKRNLSKPLRNLLKAELEISHMVCEGCGVLFALETPKTVGGLASVSSCLVLIDLVREKLVRCFGPFAGSVTQVETSVRDKWIILTVDVARPGTISIVTELRIYDLVSCCLIEWNEFDAPISAFALHPNGAFLILAHKPPQLADSSEGDEFLSHFFPTGGLHVWVNKGLFEGGDFSALQYIQKKKAYRIPLWSISAMSKCEADAARKTTECAESGNDSPDSGRARDLEELTDMMKAGKVPEHAITCSGWTAEMLDDLKNWDAIKARSVPVKPAERPEELPFFLFSEVKKVTSSHDDNVIAAGQIMVGEGEGKKELQGWGDGDWMVDDGAVSERQVENNKHPDPPTKRRVLEKDACGKLLAKLAGKRAEAQGDEAACENLSSIPELVSLLDIFESMSVPRIHFRLNTMTSPEELGLMLWILTCWIKLGKSFDFVQSTLKLFLTFHGDSLYRALHGTAEVKDQWPEPIRRRIKDDLSKVHDATRVMWDTLNDDLDSVTCFIKHIAMIQF